MEINLFGCKDTTLYLAKYLKTRDIKINLITISKKLAEKNQVAGYINLCDFKELFSKIYVAKSYNLKNKIDQDYFLKVNRANLAFCCGWQRLIPSVILSSHKFGVFGMHGSARNLPFGKGRSPMNWAILENRKFFFTNLFKYNSGVDSGPIVDQRIFSIQKQDNSETLHYKNMLSMCDLISKNIQNLNKKNQKLKEQKKNYESFYPKRTPNDSIIDWNDDIFNIERLIRAVTLPFSGAISFINKIPIYLYEASIFYTDLENHIYLNKKFGEIVEIFLNGKFLVRCSGGIMIINKYKSKKNMIKKNIKFDQNSPNIKRFKRNEYGFFDI